MVSLRMARIPMIEGTAWLAGRFYQCVCDCETVFILSVVEKYDIAYIIKMYCEGGDAHGAHFM